VTDSAQPSLAAALSALEGLHVEEDGARRRLVYTGRELGVLDGDRLELVLPRPVRDMLVETGRARAAASPDRVFVVGAETEEALELVRLAWERARVIERVRATRRG
jgi:hypothetical protein